MRLAAEEPDHRHRLLRARSEWPCDCCAAEKSDELATFHIGTLALAGVEEHVPLCRYVCFCLKQQDIAVQQVVGS
jgi:hypothetical protein